MRVFETAQHINKHVTDVSSAINALKQDTKLGGITPRGFFMQPREKTDKLLMIRRKVHISSNSAKFYPGRPLLPAYFSATMSISIPLSFRGSDLPKIFGD